MKILFICKYLSTDQNGMESRLATLVKYFKKNNYQVSAITSSISLKKIQFKKTYTLKKINNVNYYFIRDFSEYSLYSFKRIWSWINFEYRIFTFNYNLLGFKPDIIYVSSLSLFTIFNGIYLKKKFKSKLVFEMRDLWPYFLYTTGRFSKFNPLIIILSWIEKYGIYKSDLIISLIPRINKYIKYKGFHNKKCYSSTFPLNKKFFFKKKIFKISKDHLKFNICYAGNFGFDNHLEDLLNLISKTKDKSLLFNFFGDGSQKKFLQEKFSYLTNVKFYDHIEYKNLHSVLIQMNLLVVSFGFNNKYPLFGYELNKLNNYLMASKPILVIGSKKNLLPERGNFTFLTENNSLIFEKKINIIKNNYKHFLNIAKFNKKKMIQRNNPNLIFSETVKNLESL